MTVRSPAPAPAPAPVPELVFLYDIDNTLLNNDQLKSDIDTRLFRELGAEWSDLFWKIYEIVRREEDVVDIPEAIRRFEANCPDDAACKTVHDTFQELDFRRYVYPGALEALQHTAQMGTNVILSDGDPVFQRRKAEESGIAAAAEGHVLIYVHKEQHVDEILSWFCADRYVQIDDKPRILKAMPRLLGSRLVTVFVCQGHYAHDPQMRADFAPDLTLTGIGDILEYGADEFRTGDFHRQGACAIDANRAA